MKTCIVLDSLKRAGAERQALYAIGEMTRQGRDVELIYYNKATQEYDTRLAAPAVVTRLPKNGEKLRFLWKLTRHLKRGGYDVVHAFLGGTSIYVALAGRLAGASVVFGGIRGEYDGKGIIRLLHRIVNKLVTGWIVNSQATVRSMLPGVGATPDRVFVVYNGIDPSAFASSLSPAEAKRRLGLPEDSPVVLVAGRLARSKNIHLFLEMAADVSAQRPATRFLIAGDDELRDELEAYACTLGVKQVVTFLGNRPDMPDILRATDIMTLTTHYEGLSNTLLEAMSVGLPLVSTAYAGVEELFTDGREGIIVPLRDRHALTRGVLRLLDDPDLRRRMGEAGKETVAQRFTIEAMGARLYSVYEEAFRRIAMAARVKDRSDLTVLVIGTLPPPIGGAGVSIQQLLAALRQRSDIRVTLVNTGGVRGHPFLGPFRFLAIIWRVFWGARRADVVSLHTVSSGVPYMSPVAWTSARFWGKPFMIRMIGGVNYCELKGLRGTLVRWFIRRCDLYLAETKAATGAAQADGLKHAEWYATGRPMKPLPPNDPKAGRKCRRFVFLSQVKLSKGVGTLVEAADRIDQELEIDVYGPFFEGLNEDFFKNHRNVRYCGVVPPDQVDGVLSKYDALVFPTHWPGEGYPGIIMESYGVGLPVIASRWLAIPEIVDESCGVLIEPKNPDALAEAMTRLARDSDLYARLRAGARAKRDFFSAERWVDYFVKLCSSLARGE